MIPSNCSVLVYSIWFYSIPFYDNKNKVNLQWHLSDTLSQSPITCGAGTSWTKGDNFVINSTWWTFTPLDSFLNTCKIRASTAICSNVYDNLITHSVKCHKQSASHSCSLVFSLHSPYFFFFITKNSSTLQDLIQDLCHFVIKPPCQPNTLACFQETFYTITHPTNIKDKGSMAWNKIFLCHCPQCLNILFWSIIVNITYHALSSADGIP